MTRPLAFAMLFAAALNAAELQPIPNHGPGLSLRIPDEVAPAGSVVQVKVEVTEPKPISTGRGKIRTAGFAQVVGIVLMNTGQDTYGVALLDGDELSFNVVSPSSLFGTPDDYPILGIAGRVANAATGSTFPLTLDPAGLGFQDPSGAVYPYEIENGTLRIGNGVTIGDVSPGSSIVPAGGVVRISGANFTPTTRLQLHDADIREQRFISSERIDVVLARATNMHGLRIRARNEDRSESEYFSYERTTAMGASSHAILSKVVPLFAPATYTSATIALQQRATRRQRAVARGRGPALTSSMHGLALQNLGTSAAIVTVELLDGAGQPYAVNTLTIEPDRYFVRELGEIFGIVSPPSSLRVTSSVPIHILGLAADAATGTAAALPPR